MPTLPALPGPRVRLVAATTAARPLTKFGTYMMELIQSAGYDSVHAFARDVGIHHVNIGKWMDGTATPSLDGLRRAAQHLGVDLLDLIVAAEILTPVEARRTRPPAPPGPPLPAVLRSVMARLASPRLSDKRKNFLLQYIQEIVDKFDEITEQIDEEVAAQRRGRR